jgi:DNA-directed RNA polymerase subunit RPC12/RpoP
MRRVSRIAFWLAVVVGLLIVAAGVPAVYVFGPLLGLFILRIGFATFDSLSSGAAHIPDADPVPVDPRDERTVYWCEGCGAELLLIVRGTPVPPRHCGERMTERRELATDGPSSLS